MKNDGNRCYSYLVLQLCLKNAILLLSNVLQHMADVIFIPRAQDKSGISAVLGQILPAGHPVHVISPVKE